MNKPTKATVSNLTSAHENIRKVLDEPTAMLSDPCRSWLVAALASVDVARSQLTQDDRLSCQVAGCRVVKPTKRALAAHVCMSHGGR